jgi:hypothetical protein
METSRIRHALSAVQLFIERCLRNLEPKIDPGDIDADQWEWRKRYRVWQANREVFLWPENWLEPSLRDDQSPMFKTTMSQLLQSDITDDSAAGAYLDYLSNLEQVAKLEPCGICYEPATGGSGSDVAHVVARTSGAHRKHYYRRYSSGSWTPWEEIKLQIEDNPVQPYVWNGRLMLFWLQIHKRAGATPATVGQHLPKGDGKTPLAKMKMNEISGAVSHAVPALAATQVGAVLCFSEHYNGTWQPTKTSDLNNPLDLGNGPTDPPFDRTKLVLRPWFASDASDESLYLQVTTNDQFPTVGWRFQFGKLEYITLAAGWPNGAGFVLHNTHSAPLRWTDVDPEVLVCPAKARQMPRPGSNNRTLSAEYDRRLFGKPGWWPSDFTVVDSFNILRGAYPQTVRPAQQDVDDQWEQPFFLEDLRNTFYVTTRMPLLTFEQFLGYWAASGRASSHQLEIDIPKLLVAAAPVQPGSPVEYTAQLADAEVGQAVVTTTPDVRAVIGSLERVAFQGRSVGATGSTAAPDAGAVPPIVDGRNA